MKRVMSLVDLQREEIYIKELTEDRPIASLPFAGRYRLVDFALSSMVNSGIRNVGVLLPENKSRSILDHLRSGKDWDLARHHKGLFYLPPVRPENGEKASDLRNIYYNLHFVENSNEEYVLLARATSVYNIDFTKVLKFHLDRKADVTVVTSKAWHGDPCSGLILEPEDRICCWVIRRININCRSIRMMRQTSRTARHQAESIRISIARFNLEAIHPQHVFEYGSIFGRKFNMNGQMHRSLRSTFINDWNLDCS